MSDPDGNPGRATDPPPAVPPHRVRVPTNIHRWDTITFLHWPFAPQVVAPSVPPGFRVLTFGGSAWVSVTPFFMAVRPPGLPFVPPGWAFPETNVRTYVRGPDGREGLWFLRMEVTAAWFVATLRALGLPYFRQAMTVRPGAQRVVYESAPRRPGGRGGHRITIRPGAALDPQSGGPWERFVTARWGAYHRRGPLLFHTPVEHPPWPLAAATVETGEVDALFRAAGLPAPDRPPVAHFSPGITVKVGVPRLVAVNHRGR